MDLRNVEVIFFIFNNSIVEGGEIWTVDVGNIKTWVEL